jgi:hypothetical protein
LLRDDDALARAMSGVETAKTVSPLARLLMGELLLRRVGGEAGKAWNDAVGGATGEGEDALVRDVAARR